MIYFEADILEELRPFIDAIPVPLVIDHMGRPDVARAPTAPTCAPSARCSTAGPTSTSSRPAPTGSSRRADPWTISPRRSARWSRTIPTAASGAPTGRTRTCRTSIPDDGHLVDMIPRIAPTEELQRKLLIDNPTRLYWS